MAKQRMIKKVAQSYTEIQRQKELSEIMKADREFRSQIAARNKRMAMEALSEGIEDLEDPSTWRGDVGDALTTTGDIVLGTQLAKNLPYNLGRAAGKSRALSRALGRSLRGVKGNVLLGVGLDIAGRLMNKAQDNYSAKMRDFRNIHPDNPDVRQSEYAFKRFIEPYEYGHEIGLWSDQMPELY